MTRPCGSPTCANKATHRCAGCGVVYYCGTGCQRACHRHHNRLCASLGLLAAAIPATEHDAITHGVHAWMASGVIEGKDDSEDSEGPDAELAEAMETAAKAAEHLAHLRKKHKAKTEHLAQLRKQRKAQNTSKSFPQQRQDEKMPAPVHSPTAITTTSSALAITNPAKRQLGVQMAIANAKKHNERNDSDNLFGLPPELLLMIFKELSAATLGQLAQASTYLQRLLKDKMLQRHVFISRPRKLEELRPHSDPTIPYDQTTGGVETYMNYVRRVGSEFANMPLFFDKDSNRTSISEWAPWAITCAHLLFFEATRIDPSPVPFSYEFLVRLDMLAAQLVASRAEDRAGRPPVAAAEKRPIYTLPDDETPDNAVESALTGNHFAVLASDDMHTLMVRADGQRQTVPNEVVFAACERWEDLEEYNTHTETRDITNAADRMNTGQRYYHSVGVLDLSELRPVVFPIFTTFLRRLTFLSIDATDMPGGIPELAWEHLANLETLIVGGTGRLLQLSRNVAKLSRLEVLVFPQDPYGRSRHKDLWRLMGSLDVIQFPGIVAGTLKYNRPGLPPHPPQEAQMFERVSDYFTMEGIRRGRDHDYDAHAEYLKWQAKG